MTWWTKRCCPSCAGDGWRRVVHPDDGHVYNSPDSCETCNGTGVIFRGPGEVDSAAKGRLFHEGEWRWLN
jgi:DnaJ-class molecular chaperone